MTEPRPKGMHTTSAQNVVVSVAVISGSTPNWASAKSGDHSVPVKKSPIGISPKNSIVGSARATTIPTVVATDRRAQRNRTPRIKSSPYRGRATPRRRCSGLGIALASVACMPGSGRSRPLAGQLRDLVLGLRQLLLCHGDEQRLLGDLLLVLEVELDERLDLGSLQGLGARVDEQRPRQRLVAAVLHRLRARGDASVAAVDLDGLHRVRVLLGVGEAEVAHRTLRALHALNRDVVVLSGVVVGAAGSLFTVDRLGEVVERTRVGACAEELDLLIRKVRVDLAPVVDLALRLPDLVQLVDGQAAGPVVARVDDDGQAVVRDLELLVRHVVLLADRDLVLLDRARRVGDVGLAGAELLEAPAGARGAHRDPDVRVLGLEELGGRLRQGSHGARAVDSDRARELGAAVAAPAAVAAVVIVVAAGRRSQCERATDGEHEELPHAFLSFGSVMYGEHAVTGRRPSLLPGCRRLVKEM